MKSHLDRRSFLRKSSLAAGGVASIAALAPFSSLAQEGQNTPRGIPQDIRQAATSTPSLSRQFARWVSALRYEDLPPAVVDRAKGVTLQALTSALLGFQLPAGQEAVRLMLEEEAGVRNGATVMVNGAKVTKGGAAFANSEMMLAGGKYDTFRMLTHPGTSIVPSALVAAEVQGASGKEFITGLAAGYE